MADTIAVMHEGRVEQLGTPRELYERPVTRYVANFLGQSNCLEGTVLELGAASTVVDVSGVRLELPDAARRPGGRRQLRRASGEGARRAAGRRRPPRPGAEQRGAGHGHRRGVHRPVHAVRRAHRVGSGPRGLHAERRRRRAARAGGRCRSSRGARSTRSRSPTGRRWRRRPRPRWPPPRRDRRPRPEPALGCPGRRGRPGGGGAAPRPGAVPAAAARPAVAGRLLRRPAGDAGLDLAAVGLARRRVPAHLRVVDLSPPCWTTYGSQLLRSFLYAGTATVLALLIGYPLAYAIAVRAGRWRNAMLVLVVAPFFTSFLIRTLAWKIVLADDGWVVGALQAVGPAVRQRPTARHADGGGPGADLQLPAVHGAAALRQPGEDRPAAA